MARSCVSCGPSPTRRLPPTPVRAERVDPAEAAYAERALCGVNREPEYRLWTRTGAAIAVADGDRLGVCLPGPHPALAVLLRARFLVSDQDTAMCTPDLRLPATWAYAPGLA